MTFEVRVEFTTHNSCYVLPYRKCLGIGLTISMPTFGKSVFHSLTMYALSTCATLDIVSTGLEISGMYMYITNEGVMECG